MITCRELYNWLRDNELKRCTGRCGSYELIGSRYEKPFNEITRDRYYKYVYVNILPTVHQSLGFLTMIGNLPVNVQIVDIEQHRNTPITEFTGGIRIFQAIINEVRYELEKKIEAHYE